MMDTKISALYSEYVIDGVQKDLTPAQMLGGSEVPGFARIVDESMEPSLASPRTVACISGVMLDTLWRKGHFRIGNINLSPYWSVDPHPIGNMAAFYSSVEAFADHVDALGLSIKGYDCIETESGASLEIKIGIDTREENGGDKPFSVEDPELLEGYIHPFTVRHDCRSWIVYVPFELEWGQDDPDYFIDCYELVRELVEDGIVLSACTVLRDGLQKTLERYLDGMGLVAHIAQIRRYFEMSDASRILSDEVPGVLLQIRDADYDYIDAEFLLQDVAYFPLGNPREGSLFFDMTDKSGIQTILEALISSQSSEGED